MLINSSTGSEIRLKQDLTATSLDDGLVIPSGKNIIIDLNGYDLNRGLSSSTDDGFVIKVEEGATLGIKDASTEGDGKITGGNNKGNGGGIYVKGSFTLVRGTIDGNKAQNGGGIFVDGGTATIGMNSTISANNSDKDGGGLYNCGGRITVSSSTITENIANGNGGGIFTGHDSVYSKISFSGSVIEKCDAVNGGAVYTGKNGRFETNGQKIESCTASENGGAVYTENGGTSTFSGNIKISDCTATLGGGLYTNGVIGLENATIEACEATENGSGIYLASEGRIFAGKTAKVIDNNKNSVKNNVYIADGGIITLGSGSDVPAPQSGMSIGISMEKPGIFTTNGSETYAGYFSSDDASIILKNIDEGTPDDSSDDYLALGYRVLFETNGGTAVNQEFVIGGQKLTEPQAPTKEDYLFDGWYSDSEFDDEFVFSDSLTSSITLYAKWHRHNFVKVDGQAATTTVPGWKDYYECKDIADACHAYFEDPTGNTPIENIETWKAEGGNGYIAPDAINITANAVSKTVNVEEVIKINGTLKDGDNPIEFVKVYIAVNDKKYLVDTNEDGSFSAMFSSLPVGKYIFNVYYEKDGKKYDTNVTVEVIAPHEHNLVKVDGQVATTTASGWRDYYECKDIENACNKLFEDAEGTVAIDDFAKWKAEGGNGYLAPLSKYTILVTSDGNGKAVADKSEAKEKEEIILTAVPAEGYSFDYWETSPKVEITDNRFRMPESSILVMAHFKENEKPVEVYYAPLVADLKANEEGVIEWEAGDSLPLEAVKLLVDKPELSLEFTFTYEGEEHTIFIPAGAFEKYYDVTIPWYGPAWLIQYFEKSEKEVIEYTIVSGDTLNALAEKFKCTVEEILALNPYISDKHWIYPNKKLLIPVQK